MYKIFSVLANIILCVCVCVKLYCYNILKLQMSMWSPQVK